MAVSVYELVKLLAEFRVFKTEVHYFENITFGSLNRQSKHRKRKQNLTAAEFLSHFLQF